MNYNTILIDPPWEQPLVTGLLKKHHAPKQLPYPTMKLSELQALPVESLAIPGSHIWLWTTNHMLHSAFHLLESWGFIVSTDGQVEIIDCQKGETIQKRATPLVPSVYFNPHPTSALVNSFALPG